MVWFVSDLAICSCQCFVKWPCYRSCQWFVKCPCDRSCQCSFKWPWFSSCQCYAFELDHRWPLLCFAGIKEDVDYIYTYKQENKPTTQTIKHDIFRGLYVPPQKKNVFKMRQALIELWIFKKRSLCCICALFYYGSKLFELSSEGILCSPRPVL